MNRKRDLYLIAEAYKKITPLKISGKDFKKVIPKEYKLVAHFNFNSRISLKKPINVFDVSQEGSFGINNGRTFTPEEMKEATPPGGLETYYSAMPYYLRPYLIEGPGFFGKNEDMMLYVYTGDDKKLIKAIHEDYDRKTNPTGKKAPGMFYKVVLWPNITYKDYTSKDTADEFEGLMSEL